MGVDLGTYHIEVKYIGHEPIIMRWDTGARYTGGSRDVSAGSAFRIEPAWENEADLMSSMVYSHTEGNYACDCNRQQFLDEAAQKFDADGRDCGDEIEREQLTIIRPNGSRRVVWATVDLTAPNAPVFVEGNGRMH